MQLIEIKTEMTVFCFTKNLSSTVLMNVDLKVMFSRIASNNINIVPYSEAEFCGFTKTT